MLSGSMTVMLTSYFVRKQALRLTAKGRWPAARAAWRRLLDKSGARPSDYLRFVRAVERNEGVDAAAEAFQAAIRRFPTDSNLHRQHGLHLLQRHKRAEACLAFARARALSPADEVLGRDLSHLSVAPSQERGVAVRAFYEAQKPLAVREGRFDKALAKGALRMAQRAAKAGDWAEAARLYAKALVQRPRYAHGYLKLGHALKEVGNFEAAEAAYWRALALSSQKAGPFLHLGHALKLNGAAEASFLAYLAAWMIEPANADVNAELHGHGHAASDIRGLADRFFGKDFSLEALSASDGGAGHEGGAKKRLPRPLEILLREQAVRADLARMLAVEAR